MENIIIEDRPEVELIGRDGNAFAIMGTVNRVLTRYDAQHGTNHAQEYLVQATSGDYDHLLAVTMQYVDVT